MSHGVQRVPPLGVVTQVRRSVIGWVAVVMTNLTTVWFGADECCGNKLVYARPLFGLSVIEADAEIALPITVWAQRTAGMSEH